MGRSKGGVSHDTTATKHSGSRLLPSCIQPSSSVKPLDDDLKIETKRFKQGTTIQSCGKQPGANEARSVMPSTVRLRGSTPHDASVPCVLGGCENTPQSARAKNNSIFDKMPDGKGSTALGVLLIPAGCCRVDKNYGTEKTYGYFVGSNTFFRTYVYMCWSQRSTRTFFQSHNFCQRGSSQRA